jgi:hypothetical protein
MNLTTHIKWLNILAFAPGMQPDPGQVPCGSHSHEPINPRFIHTPSNVSRITATMLDLPDRGVPFRIMICPGACAILPPLVPHLRQDNAPALSRWNPTPSLLAGSAMKTSSANPKAEPGSSRPAARG